MASSTVECRPFQTADQKTDVIFIVEEEQVYFYKALLTFSSDVFERMFASDFKEKFTRQIPLPGKTLTGFVTLLKQLHPQYSWTAISEEDLEPLLSLADECNVQHVKEKCEHYIGEQIQFTLPMERVMKYLWLCEIYKLTDHRHQLLRLAAENDVELLQACSYYSRLEGDTQRELLTARCILLQGRYSRDQYERTIRVMKSALRGLPSSNMTLPIECNEDGFCVSCPTNTHICSPFEAQVVCPCKDAVFSLSDLKRSFCQMCTMPKVAEIVRNLHLLFQSLRGPHGDRMNINFNI